MNNLIKKQKVSVICYSIVLILFGVLFCVLPKASLDVLQLIASIMLSVVGVISVVQFLLMPKEFKNPIMLAGGMLLIGLGILIAVVPNIFVLIVGLIITFNGLTKFTGAFELKEVKDKTWWVDMFFGIITFLAGVALVVLFNTDIAANIVMICLGVSLIIDAIFNIIIVSVLHRTIKKAKKFMQQTDVGFVDYDIK